MNGSLFYEYVAALLQDSGHMVSSSPVYFNHSSKETLYFDSDNEVTLSQSERNLLSTIDNVSLLVELRWTESTGGFSETVNIYSVTVDFPNRTRSQNVTEVHRLLHKFWSCTHSIVFFENRGTYIISFADSKQSSILSDWFPVCADYDDVVNRIHIANMSLNSSHEYFEDFIYAIAREYYLHPISFEEASLGMIPLGYLIPQADMDSSISKSEIKNMIRDNMKYFESIYGDDYVEPVFEGHAELQEYYSLTDEIERISFELELSAGMEEDQDDDFAFEIEHENEDETYDTDDIFGEDFDDDIDPAIYDDPVLMVKWLQKKQRQSEGIDRNNRDAIC